MVACATARHGAGPFVYRRREPQGTILHEAVREHLPAFLSAALEAERPVPAFVQRELEAFLACGVVEKGAVRVRCPRCGFDRLVAFSCKGRSGICASCGARRMVDVAAHLCDAVIAEVPVRQWVITVPPPVRYLLAYDPALLAAVMRIFVRGVFAHLRRVATGELDLPPAARIECGAVCVPQRFNSALALSPHLHALVADGVWVQSGPDTTPTFRALREPTRGEVAAVAWSTCERTIGLLKKRGLWLDADADDDRLDLEQPLLAVLASASIAGVLAMGPQAGQRPLRLYGRAALTDEERESKEKQRGAKNAYGFDLHAQARAAAKDEQARERLCRYLLRPPLSRDRLARTADGRYRIILKRAWDDGTTAVVVSGQELLARLALLVPPPRVHTIRYFGVRAPRSRLRRLVVPRIAAPAATAAHGHGATDAAAGSPSARLDEGERGGRYRLSWAAALARVFAIDVLDCPRCKQQGMQQIAIITDAKVLAAMLAAIDGGTGRGAPP